MNITELLRAVRKECQHRGGQCAKCKLRSIKDGGQAICAVPADMSDKYIEKIAAIFGDEKESIVKPMIIASEADVERVADALMDRMKIYFADTPDESKEESK